MDGRAEADPVKLLLILLLHILEISQQRPDKVGNVIIESHGCQLVPRSRGRPRQSGIQRELKIDSLTEGHEFRRRVGNEVALRIQLFHDLIDQLLVGALQ